jgi:hypothetical protein
MIAHYLFFNAIIIHVIMRIYINDYKIAIRKTSQITKYVIVNE